MTSDKKGVFIQLQNTIVTWKALVLILVRIPGFLSLYVTLLVLVYMNFLDLPLKSLHFRFNGLK